MVVNFLGVAIDPKFLPLVLEGMAGQVQPVPIPCNWHADMAEWGAVLRAVDLARNTFTRLRADFLDHPLRYPEFGELLRAGMVAVAAPRRTSLRTRSSGRHDA